MRGWPSSVDSKAVVEDDPVEPLLDSDEVAAKVSHVCVPIGSDNGSLDSVSDDRSECSDESAPNAASMICDEPWISVWIGPTNCGMASPISAAHWLLTSQRFSERSTATVNPVILRRRERVPNLRQIEASQLLRRTTNRPFS